MEGCENKGKESDYVWVYLCECVLKEREGEDGERVRERVSERGRERSRTEAEGGRESSAGSG